MFFYYLFVESKLRRRNDTTENINLIKSECVRVTSAALSLQSIEIEEEKNIDDGQ